MHVDGIYIEAPLAGALVCLKNKDVPGVIGYIGTVLGSNNMFIDELLPGPQRIRRTHRHRRGHNGHAGAAGSAGSTDVEIPRLK